MKITLLIAIMSLVLCVSAGVAEQNIGETYTHNTTGKTVISRVSLREWSLGSLYGNAAYMIISSTGTVVVTDPYDVVEGLKADIITSSHSHEDHNDRVFYDANDCKQSLFTVETFSVKDVSVRGIAASHYPNNDISEEFPGNVIYVFDVDGLRIAHMGDIGQDALTEEQVYALGNLDIVFLPFEETQYSGYSIERSLTILEQLTPKLIIPTHLNRDGFERLRETSDRMIQQSIRWVVDRAYLDSLGDERTVVFLIPEQGSEIQKW